MYLGIKECIFDLVSHRTRAFRRQPAQRPSLIPIVEGRRLVFHESEEESHGVECQRNLEGGCFCPCSGAKCVIGHGSGLLQGCCNYGNIKTAFGLHKRPFTYGQWLISRSIYSEFDSCPNPSPVFLPLPPFRQVA